MYMLMHQIIPLSTLTVCSTWYEESTPWAPPFPLFLAKKKKVSKEKGHMSKIPPQTNMTWQKKEETNVERWEDYKCKRWYSGENPGEVLGMAMDKGSGGE